MSILYILQHSRVPLLCNWVIKNAYYCHSVLLHVLLISSDEAADNMYIMMPDHADVTVTLLADVPLYWQMAALFTGG